MRRLYILSIACFNRALKQSIDSMNISSAIVFSQPDQEARLRTQLSALVGVEIHAATADGKLVITIERDNDRDAIDTYEAIGRLDGVLSLSMIFQQTESNPDQELSPCK